MYKANDTEFIGTLITLKIDGDKLNFILKAKEKLQGVYYISSLEEKEKLQNDLKLGMKIKIKGTLKKPDNNTIPNTFNYKKYLASKKIYWIINVSDINIINPNTSFIYKVKNKLISRASNYEASSYMHAFILGDSSHIDEDVYNNLVNNGVTHLFAVSGMHIGLFIMVINKILKKLKMHDNGIFFFTTIFFLFYLFLVGFTASVVRATAIYLLAYLNKLFNLNIKTLNLLYILLLILLVINPFYIYDIGFIYSFTTSFGLIIFSKKITGNYFLKLLKTSTIAFLFSLPITIYFNYEFNLMTIINNLIVVPIVSLYLFPISIISFIFPFLEVFVSFGQFILENINSFLKIFTINIVIGKISFMFIILYYLGVYLIYKKDSKYIILICFLIIGTKVLKYTDKNSYVYFLDVGQGDATFIVTSNKKDLILIDSGGKIEYAKKDWQMRNSEFNLGSTIALFMKSLGISKLDLFIGTHGDMDHIGYATEIFKEIKVNKIMLNNNEINNNEKALLNMGYSKVKDNYKGKNITLHNLNSLTNNDENDSSLVMLGTLNNFKLLIMGDAPKSVELEIIKKYNLDVDILKVGHHGSNTSSDKTFLKSVNPILAIISSGRNNRFNHPSIETINNLEETEIPYYNTQDKGTIKFTIKNNKLKMATYPP